ncbi:MAG: hypothetical protein ACRC5C_03465, partial [Bacilli bacterium]
TLLTSVQKLSTKVINLNSLTQTTSVRTPIEKPKGVDIIDPTMVTVTLEIEKEQQRTFSDVPINVIGLEVGQFEWVTPVDGVVTVDVTGPSDVIEKLTVQDLAVYIDANNVEPGRNDLRIYGTDNDGYRLSVRTIEATINVLG